MTVVGLAMMAMVTAEASAQGKAPAPTAPAPATRPSKAERTKAAYEKARRLFRQSRYKAAIRAFEEVKDLQYHPILDYGIAKCHESLLAFKAAIYYLQKYVRNYPSHTMSKRHPTMADAKVKIGVLKKRLQALKARPGPKPGPGPVNPVTPPPAPGEGQPRTRAPGTPNAGTPSTDPFPGPYPFGGRAFSGVNPPKRQWVRRSILMYFGLGGGAFSREDTHTLGHKLSANGGLSLGLLWRINPYVAVGPTAYIGGGVTQDGFEIYDDRQPGNVPVNTDGARLLYANILLETRAILPVSRVDFWVAFAIGYTHISLDYEIAGEETEVTIPSVGMRGTVGLDIFLSEKFTLGLTISFSGHVPAKICWQEDRCHKPEDHHKTGVLWHLGMTFNWHLPTSSVPKVKPRSAR